VSLTAQWQLDARRPFFDSRLSLLIVAIWRRKVKQEQKQSIRETNGSDRGIRSGGMRTETIFLIADADGIIIFNCGCGRKHFFKIADADGNTSFSIADADGNTFF
jgi:hypothetical protein